MPSSTNFPILFIHYGASYYLKHVLKTAFYSNPNKKIILLGDEHNRRLTPRNIYWIPFEKYSHDNLLLEEFEKYFQPIEGTHHRYNKLRGTTFWLKFVFKRWFFIYSAIQDLGINKFWTFDSDTLLLAPLHSREDRFLNLDCTEQCLGKCLNGWVANPKLIQNYLELIISLFKDNDYLNIQRLRLQKESNLSFNEMDAWCEFKKVNKPKTRRLSQPQSGETFDDALAFVEEFEKSHTLIRNKTEVKKLSTSNKGGLFVHHKPSGAPLRLISANLSWMPEYLFVKLSKFALNPSRDFITNSIPYSNLKEIPLNEPCMLSLKNQLLKIFAKLRSSFF